MIDGDREWLESDQRGDVPTARHEILTSWRRSRLSGVDPDNLRIELGQAPTETNVARAGIPVLMATAELMVGTNTALFLSGADGVITWRWSEPGRLKATLDRSSVVVGTRMSEDVAGTNGIGTTLETHRPIVITGAEHFTEALHPFTCAGAPIRHPVTQRVIGTLSVTSMVQDASPLMATVLKKLAGEIEAQLSAELSGRDRELLRQFRRERRRGRVAVAAIGNDIAIADRSGPEWAGDAMPWWDRLDGELATSEMVQLAIAGVPSTVTARPIAHQGKTIGTLLVGVPADPAASATPSVPVAGSGRRITAPRWDELADRLRDRLTDDDRILVTGESGVGKRTLLRQVVDSVGGVQQEFDAAAIAEVGTHRWLGAVRKLLTEDLAITEGYLLFSHLDVLGDAQARALGRILDELPGTAGCPRLLGTCTVTAAPLRSSRQALLDRFTVDPLEIPPLRQRHQDISAFLAEDGVAPPTLTRDAAEHVLRHPWPGNYRQLREFRRWLERQTRAVIGVEELPPQWARGATRGRLTALQVAEADAIETALRTTDGNKAAAAGVLGLSRSTMYRKMREYQLT